MGFWSKLKPKSKPEPEDYLELNLDEYELETEHEPGTKYLKFADLGDLSELPLLKREIYDGNVLIVDITQLKSDRMMLERALRELKQAVSDVGGDIVGFKETQIAITPKNIKIERTKIGRSMRESEPAQRKSSS